jgi:hypothetical protein
MKLGWWLLFGWIAPFLALIVLYFKLWIMIITLLVKLFVWIFQRIIALAGKAINKAGLYWKNRHSKQIETKPLVIGASKFELTDGQTEQNEAEL